MSSLSSDWGGAGRCDGLLFPCVLVESEGVEVEEGRAHVEEAEEARGNHVFARRVSCTRSSFFFRSCHSWWWSIASVVGLPVASVITTASRETSDVGGGACSDVKFRPWLHLLSLQVS